MKEKPYINELTGYLKASPTSFHAVSQAQQHLLNASFIQLDEKSSWDDLPPGGYFVTRNDSSLIAFHWNPDQLNGFKIMGAHTDSPGLKIKPNPAIENSNCLQLGVEVYGGPLLSPWFDRELSIAGQVFYYDENSVLRNALIDFKKPVAIIPSLAIHLDRQANKGREINKQSDLIPLVGIADDFAPGFGQRVQDQLLAEHPNSSLAEVVDFDLFLYDPSPPSTTGFDLQLLTGGRLDNLLSCFAGVKALVTAQQPGNAMVVLYDHEEIGSVSAAGAQGTFLADVLARLCKNQENLKNTLARSFFISADNAHAVHPNFPDKHDPHHMPKLNGGVVIKYNANLRYATSAKTAAIFRRLSLDSQVPVQEFVMRNDMTCGSTIGPVTSASLGIDTVDVGIPTLAMHSIRETAACTDCLSLYTIMHRFFSESQDKR